MSTLIRNTTTLEFGIDRRVGRAGHGEHGGWSLSQGTTIICSCGTRLFELADLKAAARTPSLVQRGLQPPDHRAL
jgi:hypothetical protein